MQLYKDWLRIAQKWTPQIGLALEMSFFHVQVSTKSIRVSHLGLLNVLTGRTEPILCLPSNFNQCYQWLCIYQHYFTRRSIRASTQTTPNGKISMSQTPDGWSVHALANWKRQTHKGLSLSKRGTKPSFCTQTTCRELSSLVQTTKWAKNMRISQFNASLLQVKKVLCVVIERFYTMTKLVLCI